MWICTNKGFVSIVEHRDHPMLVIIRSRREEDLQHFTGSQIVEKTDTADYRFRVVTSKAHLKEILARHVENIMYDNFKKSVDDIDLQHFYGEIWSSGIANLDPDWIERHPHGV